MRYLLVLLLVACSPPADVSDVRASLTDAGPACSGDPSVDTWEQHAIFSSPDSDGVEVALFGGKVWVAGAFERGQSHALYGRMPSLTLHRMPDNPRDLDEPDLFAWPYVPVSNDLEMTEGVLLHDFDDDGLLDVVGFSSWNDATQQGIIIYFADNDYASFTEMVLPTSAGASDRWLDGIVFDGGIAAYGETSRVDTWDLPTSDVRTATNWTHNTVARVRHAMQLHEEDVDDDGNSDLVFAARRTASDYAPEGFGWAENGTTGGSGGTWTIHSYGAEEQAVISCAGDIDSDGDIDYMVPYLDPGGLSWFEQDGSSFTEHTITLPASLSGKDLKGCELADLDLDGDLDIALTTASAGNNVWYVEQTATSWTFVAIDPASWESKLDDPRAFDVDGDGDYDIITSGENSSTGLVWHENPRCD